VILGGDHLDGLLQNWVLVDYAFNGFIYLNCVRNLLNSDLVIYSRQSLLLTPIFASSQLLVLKSLLVQAVKNICTISILGRCRSIGDHCLIGLHTTLNSILLKNDAPLTVPRINVLHNFFVSRRGIRLVSLVVLVSYLQSLLFQHFQGLYFGAVRHLGTDLAGVDLAHHYCVFKLGAHH